MRAALFRKRGARQKRNLAAYLLAYVLTYVLTAEHTIKHTTGRDWKIGFVI
jgi:hypothetical protein